MKKILYLGDPRSIHDIKWVSFFSSKKSEYRCYFLARKAQMDILPENFTAFMESEFGITFLGCLPEFSILNFMRTLLAMRFLKQIIRKNKIDLLHIFYAHPNALWIIAKKYFGVPVVLTTRGSDVLIDIPKFQNDPTLINKILFALYLKAFKSADAIVSTSKKQILLIHKMFSPPRTELIRTGVNTKRIVDFTEPPLVENRSGKKIVFFPRKMEKIYNHELGVNAISKLPYDLMSDLLFVFVDRDNQKAGCGDAIEQKLNSIPYLDYRFYNCLDQESMFRIYKDSSLAIMTPFSDGTPNSALEAMAFRIPVILGPADYDEDIFNLKTVLRMKSSDPSELAELIKKVFADKETPQRTNEAFDTVNKLGDREKEMSKLESIYLSLIQPRIEK
jgi:glycosyltransferase involved in cell wall biosynthesis